MINWFIWKWYVVIRAISLFQEDVSSQSHLDSYAFYLIIYSTSPALFLDGRQTIRLQ
nr:hypothetical protein [uncultured Prevotella sp.]